MKTAFAILACLGLVLTGCNEASEPDNGSKAMEPAVVYASNYPLYFFAKKIGGDKLEVRFPAASANDPAYWEPVADTIAAMQNAGLIFLNGASYEQWLMNVSLPNTLIVNTSHSFEDRLLEGGETFTHSHGSEGEHQHQGTAFTTWMDLSLAARQAGAIREALIKQWPEQEAIFNTNYQDLSEALIALHNAFKQVSTGEPDLHVAFSHPVYQYFQAAYGVKGKSLHWEPDQELTHDMIHELEHLMEEQGIRHLIWEAPPLPATVEALEAMNIRSLVISPAGNKPESGSFLEIMQTNLKALREVYGLPPDS